MSLTVQMEPRDSVLRKFMKGRLYPGTPTTFAFKRPKQMKGALNFASTVTPQMRIPVLIAEVRPSYAIKTQ